VPRRSQKASAEIAAADRKARAVELRSRGYSFQQIADTLGYANPSGASKAYHAALRARPAQNVDQLRAEAATRYEYLLAESVRQIEQPGPRVSAIGKLAVFPAGHPRAGEIVEDESIRNRGIESARKVINDYARLTGAELGPSGFTLPDLFITRLAEARAAQERMDRQAPMPVLAPLPGNYATLPPARQAEADITRRRVQVDAHQAAIAAAGADVVDAEIVGDD